MPNEPQRYLSYLVRLWREASTAPSGWRASVEEASTGIRRGFADIDSLFAFLKAQTNDSNESVTHTPSFGSEVGLSSSGETQPRYKSPLIDRITEEEL